MLREIKTALKACRNPVETVNGKKHVKVFIGGRLATCLPHGSKIGCHRAIKNYLADIRRADAACHP